MTKSIHSTEYRVVLQTLLEMRQKAGLTQRALAGRLGRAQSFVWGIETGRRRLDVVEFAWVCRAMGCDPFSMFSHMAGQWDSATPSTLEALPHAAESDKSAAARPKKRSKKYPVRHRKIRGR